VVAVDRPIRNVATDVFTVDNRAASFHATQHLIGHGHRSIICIADEERIYTRTERVEGYSEAMRAARLKVRVCLVGGVAGSLPDQLAFHLEAKRRPTAIFATSNVLGIDVLRELQRWKMKIPEDVALLCFDDFSPATLVSPTITVVQQPVAALGQRAAQLLLERIESEREAPPSDVVLPTQLILRQSCGC